VCALLQNDVNDVIDHCVKKNRIDDAVFWYMLSTVLSTSQEVANKGKGKSKDSDVRVVEFKDDFRLTPTVFTPAVKALAVVRSHFLELFAS
jgi:hypothetical protein